ncbi:MAG TPA: glycerol-3-phosphate 1-O-acyltransferase PlsY [Candidatus Limnocylindria bacterium]
MNGPGGAAILVAIGYLVGAVPIGLAVSRLVGGFDLRQYGSGRTGATNALRTLGTRWAVVVLVLDVLKGVIPVLVARALFRDQPAGAAWWVAAAAGLAAVIGHNWSAFIGFSGGRGVATSGGALLALAPAAMLAVVPIAGLVAWRTRFVSLGSLTAAGVAVVATTILAAAGIAAPAAPAFALGAALLIAWSHRDNVARLRAGTERRLGEREVVGR